ncbi:MAG: NAD(P)/FAD-dependent oxidoreductase [Candidatus Obscuribacterales bacterium]|nr:NAD(P)/FAD-dependent oxidoreductase [Candidatus Obscuribacterales bacterium]
MGLAATSKSQLWDAVVIGAGPAGSMSAYLLAKQGLSVLLLEKTAFPRQKVCGSCLNGVALQILAQNGLGDLVNRLKAVPLKQFTLFSKEKSASLALQDSKALSRELFDHELAKCAVKAGSKFIDKVQATVERIEEYSAAEYCEITAKHDDGSSEILRSKITIVADGLMGRSLDKHPEYEAKIDSSSRIGAGAVLHESSNEYKAGIIYMSAGQGGYVGAVRLEDNKLDVAAAFDLDFIRKAGSPANAAMQIIEETKMPSIKALLTANWHGTGALSRSRKQIAGRRIFVVGDATSYAEPLTGEGIAWALLSANALAPIAKKAIDCWETQFAHEWTKLHSQLIRQRQSNSSRLARILRHSALTSISMEILKVLPLLGESMIHYMNSPTPIAKVRILHKKTQQLEEF